jgi:hypothetical protein
VVCIEASWPRAPVRITVATTLAALALACAGAAAAEAKVETKTLGQVEARLSYDQRGIYDYRNVRIKILRAGRKVLDKAVPAPCDGCQVILARQAPNGRSLRLRQLDGDSEPEAIVDLFTGGAHCCFLSVIYGYSASADKYRHLTHDWHDPSYSLSNLDQKGAPEFSSADARFAYVFTAYAQSRFPIQIWHYKKGKMVDVTRQFPKAVRKHASGLLAEYDKSHSDHDMRGVVAAYVADQYLLGEAKKGWDMAETARKDGALNGTPGDSWPKRKAYLDELRKFLEKRGYAASASSPAAW